MGKSGLPLPTQHHTPHHTMQHTTHNTQHHTPCSTTCLVAAQRASYGPSQIYVLRKMNIRRRHHVNEHPSTLVGKSDLPLPTQHHTPHHTMQHNRKMNGRHRSVTDPSRIYVLRKMNIRRRWWANPTCHYPHNTTLVGKSDLPLPTCMPRNGIK